MAEKIERVVYQSLAAQLGVAVTDLEASADRSLEELGLDSHGLMRVLLVIEQGLGLSTELDLDDEYLESPRSLCAGVAAAVA
ncbi:MAG: acyl carrier protein [Planctomycetota bacterium]|nr:acyl carrier protein [Planctomycetota bacterium]